jgi:hypothetical protein
MGLLLTIAGSLIQTVHASNLDNWGAGGSGVSDMWSDIRNALHSDEDLSSANILTAFAESIVTFVLSIIGGVAVLLILYAAIRIIIGQGKEEAISEAKTIVMYALIGIVLALLAGAVIMYFGSVFFPTLFV